MENLEKCGKQEGRNSAAILQDRITELEHRLAQVTQNLRNKEMLVKMQSEQLKKMEEMHKKSLDEIECLNCNNNKTMHDMENLKIIITKGNERNKASTKDAQTETDYELQERQASKYELRDETPPIDARLNQQEQMLNAIFTMIVRNGSKKLKNPDCFKETQCELLVSRKTIAFVKESQTQCELLDQNGFPMQLKSIGFCKEHPTQTQCHLLALFKDSETQSDSPALNVSKTTTIQCDLLDQFLVSSSKSKYVIKVLENKIHNLNSRMEKYKQFPRCIVDNTCDLAEEKVCEVIDRIVSKSSSSLTMLHNSHRYRSSGSWGQGLTTVPERDEYEERLGLLEEENELLKKTLEKLKKNCSITKNMLSEAQMVISKCDTDAGLRQLENDKLKSELLKFKGQFADLISKIQCRLGKKTECQDKKSQSRPCSSTCQTLCTAFAENINIDEYVTKLLHVLNDATAEEDSTRNALVNHQGNSNLNKICGENKLLRRKLRYLTQASLDDNALLEEYVKFKQTFQRHLNEIMENRSDITKADLGRQAGGFTIELNPNSNEIMTRYTGSARNVIKESLINELNELLLFVVKEEDAFLRSEFSDETLLPVIRRACGKLKACFQVQASQITVLNSEMESLEVQREEMIKINKDLQEEFKTSISVKHACIAEINNLIFSLDRSETLLEYNTGGERFEQHLKQVCGQIKHLIIDVLKRQDNVKEVAQLLTLFGCESDSISDNDTLEISSICNKIKSCYQIQTKKETEAFNQTNYYKREVEAIKSKCFQILEAFVEETTGLLKLTRSNRKVSLNYNNLDTLKSQVQDVFSEIKNIIQQTSEMFELDKQNFELIKLNENLIKEIEDLKSNTRGEFMQPTVLKELLKLLNDFEYEDGVHTRPECTILNIKDICDQLRALYRNIVSKGNVHLCNLENLKLQYQKTIMQNEALRTEVERLRSEKIDPDDITELMMLIGGREGISQYYDIKSDNIKSICNQIKSCYAKQSQERFSLKNEVRELLNFQKELFEENARLNTERAIIKETLIAELNEIMVVIDGRTVFFYDFTRNNLADQYKEFCARIKETIKIQMAQYANYTREVEDMKAHKSEHSSLNDTLMHQIKKLVCLINQKERSSDKNTEEAQSQQIEYVYDHIRASLQRNFNTDLDGQCLQKQVEDLKVDLEVLKGANRNIAVELLNLKMLKKSFLSEINSLNSVMNIGEEIFEDDEELVEKLKASCKQIKYLYKACINSNQIAGLKETCEKCFVDLLETINSEDYSMSDLIISFNDTTDLKNQLASAFATLKARLAFELKLKTNESLNLNGQLRAITKKFNETLQKMDELHELNSNLNTQIRNIDSQTSTTTENFQHVLSEMRERIQFLESNESEDLRKSKHECETLRENVKKIKENISIASSLRKKYFDLMDKYYKQNSELAMQNEFMKEHIGIIGDYKNKLKDSEERIVKQNDSIQSLSHRNDDYKRLIDESEMLILKIKNKKCEDDNSLKIELAVVVEKMQILIREKEQLQRESQIFKDNLKLLNENNERLQKTIQLSLQDKEELKRKLDAYKNQETSLSLLNESNERLEKTVKLSIDDKEVLKRKLDAYKKQERRVCYDVANLKEDMQKLVADRNCLQQKLAEEHEANMLLAQMNKKLQDFIKDKGEQSRKLSEANDTINEVSQIKMQLQEITLEKEELQRQLQADRKQLQQKLEDNRDANIEMIQLKKKLQDILLEKEQLQKTSHNDMKQLQLKLMEDHDANLLLKKKLQEIALKNEGLERKLDAERKQLQQKLTEYQDTNIDMIHMKKKLQEVLAEKEVIQRKLDDKFIRDHIWTETQKRLADIGMQEILAENETLRRKLDNEDSNLTKMWSEMQKIVAEKEHIEKKVSVEVTQLREEVQVVYMQKERLQRDYDVLRNSCCNSELKQTIDECENYKNKLELINEKINRYKQDQSNFEAEFEVVKANLMEENMKLRRKLSVCTGILTDFNSVLKSSNLEDQICSLKTFIKKRDKHIRLLLEQKVEACKLLEILMDNVGKDSTGINFRETLSPAVKAAQSVVETLITNIFTQDERYSETNMEIENNDRFLKDKLKDLENKKNTLKSSLEDLTQLENSTSDRSRSSTS